MVQPHTGISALALPRSHQNTQQTLTGPHTAASPFVARGFTPQPVGADPQVLWDEQHLQPSPGHGVCWVGVPGGVPHLKGTGVGGSCWCPPVWWRPSVGLGTEHPLECPPPRVPPLHCPSPGLPNTPPGVCCPRGDTVLRLPAGPEVPSPQRCPQPLKAPEPPPPPSCCCPVP